MGFFDSISGSVKGYFDKNKKNQEMMDELQHEADLHRLQVFKEQFRTDSKRVAEAQAKKEASELSGLQKLRATNRSRRLNEKGPEPGSFFEKLSTFTQNNKARMTENMKRTQAMRAVAETEKAKRLDNIQTHKQQNLQKTSLLRDRRSTW